MNSLAHQPPQIARANGIDLCYEIFGDATDEPILLIMGLGAQMIHWDDDFCRALAGRGLRRSWIGAQRRRGGAHEEDVPARVRDAAPR